ncbi:MAG: molecular chaperone HtpG [Bacteroidia bacterium]|nr:molecular chaperone HtpG [Bacteroidia bacterium]MDW8332923.1 molecular chaperone HtpG [Bacteroidia bacterium]
MTGTLSIQTENIFPIIKRFLYSDRDIFLRELVSNAIDALHKIKAASQAGDFQGELGELTVTVSVDENARTLTVSDNGVGMTAEETDRYINQIAFSGAKEFVEKYQGKIDGVIGRFGLGFYSAFMVADKVELVTRSYKSDKAVTWSCDGSVEYVMGEGERPERGTDVVLHISQDADEFLRSWRIEEILKKYCRFLPYTIRFQGKVVNNNSPAWIRKPAELTDEDYKNFYKELFPYAEAPLFWIHLNVDYPFTLKGILYFPKLRKEVDIQKNKIHLYCNQVFVTDSVEDVVPDYLSLLHGVIDSPDIPLNVSRSYLQGDANVKKISGHISKKVADKLREIFDSDRAAFEKAWENVGIFVKYGVIRDHSFYEKTKDLVLVHNTENRFFTLDEYRKHVEAKQTDRHGKVVFLYATDPQEQFLAVQNAKNLGYDVLVMDGLLDVNFIQYIEFHLEKTSFVRVDADGLDKLIDKGVEAVSLYNEQEEKELTEWVKRAAEKIPVELRPSSTADLPIYLSVPESQRRMADMQRLGMLGSAEIPDYFVAAVNTSSDAFKRLFLLPSDESRQKYLRFLLDLALLSAGRLEGEALSRFVRTAAELASKIV